MNRNTIATTGRALTQRRRTAKEKPRMYSDPSPRLPEPVERPEWAKVELPKGESRVPVRCQADWCRQFIQPDRKRPGVCNFCETPIGEKRSYKDR